MDTAIFNIVSSACGEILSANGFKCNTAEGKFTGENADFNVKYDDERKQFILEYVDKAANGEPVELSSWLFEGENKNDAVIIGEDFASVVSVKLGIKKPTHGTSSVAMPTRSAAGEQHGAESLTQKLLAVFPQFKDDYREHVASIGSYCPITFMKQTIVPKLSQMTDDFDANRKALEKTFKMLGEVYYNCDRSTTELICGVIVAGAFKGKTAEFEKLAPALEDYPYFMTAGREILKYVGKNKKYAQIFDD